MFFIRSCFPKKIWICSLHLRGQRTLTLSAVNWMMKRGIGSPQETGSNKKLKKMEYSDHTPKSASEPQRRYASLGNVKEVTGDLFRCPDTHSLAHCISADVKMGKGIAVMFKEKFHGVNELLEQNQRPGGLAVLNRDGRFIYYLVTKERYWMKPTYETLYNSLVKMRDHNRTNSVTHLCMPKIGCGLDRLEWDKVLDMIQQIYAGLDIQITIYHYENDKKGAGRGRGDPRAGVQEQYWRSQRDQRGQQDKRDQQDQQDHRSNSGHRHREYGTRHQLESCGGGFPGQGNFHQSRPARQPFNARENQEYGPALPDQHRKECRGQTQIQDYCRQTASRKVEEKTEETKQRGKEKGTKDHDEGRAPRNPKNASSSPIKIKRECNSLREHQHDGSHKTKSDVETQGRGSNDGTRKDERQDDGNKRKGDGQNKRQNEGRSADQLRKVEEGNQETSKNDEKDQRTRDSSQERRKESIDEKQDEHNSNKRDAASEDKSEDKIEQKKMMNAEGSLHEYKEDSAKTSDAQSECQSECKNSDDVSLAPAIESTITTPQERGRGCEDEGGASGSHEDTEEKKKKKKRKKKKKKKKSGE